MTAWQPGVAVEVLTPASSANLGPGFDSIGLALGIWDRCHATVVDAEGVEVTVDGEGAQTVPADETHLVLRSAMRAFAEFGEVAPGGLALHCHNGVPHGRGLGSSATAIVTGIALAHALIAARDGRDTDADGSIALDRESIGALAADLEGHPDNSSASVYGGLTLSWSDAGKAPTTLCLHPHPDVRAVICVPDAELSTASARAALPTMVRHADAAANSARAAVLIHALTTDPRLLFDGTQDWLHQEPRRPAYPESMALLDTLRERGHAAVISGAGPAVLVLGVGDEVEAVSRAVGGQWRTQAPGIPDHGVHAHIVR